MAKATKGMKSKRLLQNPMPLTLEFYSEVLNDEKIPEELKALLPTILKSEEIKEQKQGFKKITELYHKSETEAKGKLRKFLLCASMDFALTNLKTEIGNLLNTDEEAVKAIFEKDKELMDRILFSETVPLSHLDYLFTRYLERSQRLDLRPRDHSKILHTIITKIEVEAKKHLSEASYNVRFFNELTSSFTFLTSYIPKYFSEPTSEDLSNMMKLTQFAKDLLSKQYVDRDILTLSGITYWICSSIIIRSKIGKYSSEKELQFLNALIIKQDLDLSGIEKIPLLSRIPDLEKSSLTIGIIRGLIRVIQDLEILYVPIQEPSNRSYFDYLISCCDTEQVNIKIFALLCLHDLIMKETERKESKHIDNLKWVSEIAEVLISSLDSPHKGTVKAAEDDLKQLYVVMNKRGMSVGKVIMPMIHSIPDALRKRKLIVLNSLNDPSDSAELQKYIRYCLDTISVESALTRLASVTFESILKKCRIRCATTEEWLQIWADDFLQTLYISKDKILVLSNTIMTIVLAIDVNALQLLILAVLEKLKKFYTNEYLIILLAFLIEARRLKKLEFHDEYLKISDKLELELGPSLVDLIFGLSDSNAVLLALNFCNSNPKGAGLPELIDKTLIKHGMEMKHTNNYDDYREKHMKLVQKFLTDLKLKFKAPTERLEEFKGIAQDILAAISDKLRLDSPYDPLFHALKAMKHFYDFFGETLVSLKFPRYNDALFLVQLLSSSWEPLRKCSYDVLEKFPISIFSKEEWEHFTHLAIEKLCSQRSGEPEGAAFFLKLLFTNQLKQEGFDIDWKYTKPEADTQSTISETNYSRKQYIWINNMFNRIKCKRTTLKDSLFKHGKIEDLFHGEILFINLVLSSLHFDQDEKHLEWKELILSIMSEMHKIADYCESLLFSHGIVEDETGALRNDCRGIWLVARETGTLHTKLAEWLAFPGYGIPHWISGEEIQATAFSCLNNILAYQHRGAYLKLVDSLQVILYKSIRSNSRELQDLPGKIIEKIFAVIQQNSIAATKTLRKSAGIPPSILTVLRSEAFPIQLDRTIKWLLERAKDSSNFELRVHSLNILKVIFEDSEIHHNIQEYMYDALIVATEGLSDSEWKVRNSSLNVFTASTKRIFGSCSTLEKFLNRQGKSVYEFFGYSEFLCKFMLDTLRKVGTKNDENSKFAIFPILLLFSRLTPSPFVKNKMHIAKYIVCFKEEMMKMLGHGDIGVREMAAKAIIPLVDSTSYLSECSTIIKAISIMFANNPILYQNNLLHGLLFFVHQLLRIYTNRPTSAPEELLKFIKLLDEMTDRILGGHPLLHIPFFRIIQKTLKSEGVTHNLFTMFYGKSLKYLSKPFSKDESQPSTTNSIKEIIQFVLKYENKFASSLNGVNGILEKLVSGEDWNNVAYCYQIISKRYEKLGGKFHMIDFTLYLLPIFIKKSLLDPTKYCLKCLIRRMQTEDLRDQMDLFWEIFNSLAPMKIVSKQIEKLWMVFGCRLVGKLLQFYDPSWIFTGKAIQNINEILDLIFDTQYNEDRHPIRICGALAFREIIHLVNPDFPQKCEFHPEILSLHFKAIRIVMQLLYSENQEIRNYVSKSLSNIVHYSSYFSIKSDSKTERIEIQNPVLNSNRIFHYYMDLLERSVLAAKNEALLKNYIDLLYEFCKNEFFLESDKKNTGKNLIFIYEALNSYIVNVDIQLLGFSKLSNIPTESLKKYLVLPAPKTVLTAADTRKKLLDIHLHPSITSKLSFINFVGELIDQFVYFELLHKDRTHLKPLVESLADLLNPSILVPFARSLAQSLQIDFYGSVGCLVFSYVIS